MQSKSITKLKAFNVDRLLDFYSHRMNDTPSNKNLARALVIIAFQLFITIPTA